MGLAIVTRRSSWTQPDPSLLHGLTGLPVRVHCTAPLAGSALESACNCAPHAMMTPAWLGNPDPVPVLSKKCWVWGERREVLYDLVSQEKDKTNQRHYQLRTSQSGLMDRWGKLRPREGTCLHSGWAETMP